MSDGEHCFGGDVEHNFISRAVDLKSMMVDYRAKEDSV